MDWQHLFQHTAQKPPATDAELAHLQESVLAPLSDREMDEINARQSQLWPATDPLHAGDQPFDSSRWQLPQRRFPESYVDFLRWSNGGDYDLGERFWMLFSVAEIRGHLLDYQLPEYMPGAVPFGFDGAGTFYLFDMREAPIDGEYPIVMAHSGSLGWDEDDSLLLAQTFPQAIANSAQG